MGKVYLVGAGPGDPGLITVKGLRLIQKADVILYDRLVNEELLDQAKKTAKLIYCGKSPSPSLLKQDRINRMLVSYAQSCQTVVRLKGGDPFVFGRGGEEAAALASEGITYEIVPGITAGIAAAAYAGIPVTHRQLSSSVALITGHYKQGCPDKTDWDKLTAGIDTLVIYMGLAALPHIVSELTAVGRNLATPCAVIEWGTTIHQRTTVGTLATICEDTIRDHIGSPALIVVGEVIRLRDQLKWFENANPVEKKVRRAF